jgi:transaldolase
MVKIPATKEGLPAIEQCLAEGMNINITLIFSISRYREVATAHISGLERRLREGKPVAGVASVASVFVSRIDTLVDEMLNVKIASATGVEAERIRALAGESAVANSKMVYQAFREISGGARFRAIEHQGAALQRPLWGSTGTKNPRYSDLHYVNPLIGPHTVNTVPPATYDAILNHGTAKLTIESELDAARATLRSIGELGIDIDMVTDKLERDGVAAFEKSFDGLYRNLEDKRKHFTAVAVPRG